jgi:homoserine dehydrogenase
MTSHLKIGLFGFGCVGQGLYDILNHNDYLTAEVVKICIKHPQKPRSLSKEFFTTQKQDILQNPEINLVVELIDNAEEAFEIVAEALKNGKNVVTANKKMLAEHLPELVAIQQEYGTSLLYEASACGSIPIIRTLEEYYNNELLFSVKGIFNGSSNYILTKVIQENQTYENALLKAQELGFAETDPTLDVGGFDPKYKLCILALHAYGIFAKPEEVFNYGIQSLSEQDLKFAKEKGYKIKLIAQSQKIQENQVALLVMPQFVDASHPLYHTENEFNGVIVEAAFSQRQTFIGKGAGGHPTGSAVLSDISALLYGYRYEYKKLHNATRKVSNTSKVLLEVYVRYQTQEDFELFDFEEITEKYNGNFNGENSNYVIGKISLENLLEIKPELLKRNIFIVNTGKDLVFFSKEKIEKMELTEI